MINDLKKILARVQPVVLFFKRYAVMIFIVGFMGVYAYLVIRVNTLVQTEPSAGQLTEKLKDIKRTKIDEDAVSSILRLQDQNIEVESLFEEARNNPFSE